MYRYPDEDRDVADEARLSLVLLDLDKTASDEELPKETEEFVTRILKQHGKGFRKHANVLIFLAPDTQRASEVIDAARRLLALRSIDDHKPTKAQLTEEQLKDLAARLKEAEARLPAALTTAYRHVPVPDKNKTIRCFDMGISVGKATLSQKVLDKLKDEQQILNKLDPAILIGERFGLWPQDQEMVNVLKLADYFTQLTHLPMLLDNGVLPDCIARGVQRGLFGYALGDGAKKQFDTILFAGSCSADEAVATGFQPAGTGTLETCRHISRTTLADQCEITESAWLLRPALAKSLLPGLEPISAGKKKDGESEHTGDDKTTDDTATDDGNKWKPGKGGGVKLVKGERRLNRVRISMYVPWDQWNDIYNEVIDPLAKEGADLLCQVIVVAQGDAAIRENTVELVIKESLSQRGIKAEIQTG